MIEMCRRIPPKPITNVDLWDLEDNPIPDGDRWFRNVRGQIILPICDFLNLPEENRGLDFFAMKTKRSYNSDETRSHICRYLNYFLKYYDTDKELLMYMYQIKEVMDFNREYKRDMFMNDVNLYIIRNPRLYRRINRFVEDNYLMSLANRGRTPNLQYEDAHAKILYEISLLSNIYIPLATHYMYLHSITKSEDIYDFMLELFDLCNTKYEEEQGIIIYNKMYETAYNVVSKSIGNDAPLWEMNLIRGNNPTLHTEDSTIDIIMQTLPKYVYNENIINFNYFANRKCLHNKVIGVSYEFQFQRLSSSKRDADQHSEFDRFEARLSKRDEAMLLQNKVSCEQTINVIEMLYGPFESEEIEFYRRRLREGYKPIIQEFQKHLIRYTFCKHFGDPISFNPINDDDYIKMIIASKRLYMGLGMVILPWLLSSKVIRVSTRVNINKKEQFNIESSKSYHLIEQKYGNPKLKKLIFDMIGRILSSSYEIIDFDPLTRKAGSMDGEPLPIVNEILDNELCDFINMI